MAVDTLDEAKLLVREQAAYLLDVLLVRLEQIAGMNYRIYVNSDERGIVHIRKTV